MASALILACEPMEGGAAQAPCPEGTALVVKELPDWFTSAVSYELISIGFGLPLVAYAVGMAIGQVLAMGRWRI